MPAQVVNEKGSDNSRKIHVSRIPTSFNEKSVQRILEEKLGPDTVEEIVLIYKRPEDDDDDDDDGGGGEKKKESKKKKSNQEEEKEEHRGFGFVTLKTNESYQEAVELQSIRGGRKPTSSRKHTLYLRPYSESEDSQRVCFLWTQHRCPYGDDCKFDHPKGKGGLLVKGGSKKVKKCFQYKKTGKCTRKDCPFSHDFEVENQPQSDVAEAQKETNPTKQRPDQEKDCIDWKSKGRCKKHEKNKCPYRHEESVREAALLKKKRKVAANEDADNSNNSKKQRKEKQPLWVRVFGMNYETREHDIREFLKDCGTIMEVQFPRFEDSGRSKGYCGVLFQSPKAVAKALELDGQELMGRWLRIQAGKMLLDQWEDREAQQKQDAIEVSND